jgi:uncharacterized membrane protein
MEKPQEPLFSSRAIAFLIAGFAISAFLFYEMMKFAEAGNLTLVILTSISISIVAVVILKYIKHLQKKNF